MGKLIVLEGTDGSGKSTQFRLLTQYLEEKNTPFRHIVFPRYDQESSALIRMYLGGAFGSKPGDVNAYAASAFYAVDRYASYKQDWGNWYEAGGLIFSDRYTTSNAVHQASKLPQEQQKLQVIAVAVKQGMNVARTEQYIENLLAETRQKPGKVNVGAFLNNLNQSLARIQLSGIPAVSERRETDSQIVLTITIPK